LANFKRLAVKHRDRLALGDEFAVTSWHVRALEASIE
jgi:hypothetical protein